ncbi:MAG: WYL domain-containing protein [Clostridia bacterium]|nr:WYL domain-containing protein [Clostridia bacterium]
MAYNELIKNFGRIRDYMREFYLYGFKSREEFTKKSARSYDDEKRRLESWLGDCMRFRQTPEGKNVFISIDSRLSRRNPLYAAWKARSFTDGDITLHFILFDILYDPALSLTLSELTAEIDLYLQNFDEPRTFDESTVRKKLKEYVNEGIVIAEKRGKTVYYRRSADDLPEIGNLLDFFSEAAPLGVIGSFLLDKMPPREDLFTFKHHYITGAMDSEIACTLLTAIGEKRCITLETVNRHNDRISENHVVPLRIMYSTRSGRQYLMAYAPRFKQISSYRTDNIVSVRIDEVCERYDELRARLEQMAPHLWGVSTQSASGQRILEHVSFTVRYEKDEMHIHQRLVREKRCGSVEKLDVNTSRFTADVYDAGEMMPWIRSFICRITDFQCTNRELERQFREDLRQMYALYGLEGGEEK